MIPLEQLQRARRLAGSSLVAAEGEGEGEGEGEKEEEEEEKGKGKGNGEEEERGRTLTVRLVSVFRVEPATCERLLRHTVAATVAWYLESLPLTINANFVPPPPPLKIYANLISRDQRKLDCLVPHTSRRPPETISK